MSRRCSSNAVPRTTEGVWRCSLLVKDGETTKLSIGMVILCSVQNFGYYGVMIWLPNYLSTRFGFALTQSAMWTCGDDRRHGGRHLPVRPYRRPHRPPAGLLRLHARRGDHGVGLFAPDRSDRSC